MKPPEGGDDDDHVTNPGRILVQVMAGLGLPCAVQWSATLYSPWTVVTLCSRPSRGGLTTVILMVSSSLSPAASTWHRYSPSSDRLRAQL